MVAQPISLLNRVNYLPGVITATDSSAATTSRCARNLPKLRHLRISKSLGYLLELILPSPLVEAQLKLDFMPMQLQNPTDLDLYKLLPHLSYFEKIRI